MKYNETNRPQDQQPKNTLQQEKMDNLAPSLHNAIEPFNTESEDRDQQAHTLVGAGLISKFDAMFGSLFECAPAEEIGIQHGSFLEA